MDLVIYHKDCSDGFCAAWLLVRNLDIPESNTFACHHGDAFPISDDKLRLCTNLYVVDFSYPPSTLRRLAGLVGHVYVYDHHETAIKELASEDLSDVHNLTLVLDQKRSGARITYDELNLTDETERRIANYVQDRDLWQWRLGHSREINAYLGLEYDHTRWNNIADSDMSEWRKYGALLLVGQQRYVEKIINNDVYRMAWHDKIVGVVNVSGSVSEIGAAMLDKHSDIDIAMMYFDIYEGGKRYRVHSLRSRVGSGIKVNDIAKAYGGGGHPCAAGFKTCMSDFYV